ncbi:alpha/beta hydrolase [Actinomadura viridis]|uniref:Pimeloyl-ACP methyl ester carboxylesterase n=1 Tax=Actinomadura viridis TaxID=58110 RepID=A0A931DS76_9ACTN|nr:alpha/beta fold hydrolase [Actinomadura viridis]MBG6092861.1 pimeloyl-ACP methyl ester carboxylesterase [Actinomadura viridis]
MKLGRFTSSEGRAAFDAAYDAGLRTLPEPAESTDVPTAFGRVRAYRFGDAPGPPLVLLHGRGATAVSWEPNIAPLAEHLRVYAIDLLGEPGRSVQTAPIHDADDQAAWLAETLDGLGIEAAHLAGTSIGGWLACNLAVHRPEKVASLALLDPAATFARFPMGMLLRTIPVLVPFTANWATPRFMRWIDGQGHLPGDDPLGLIISTALRHYRPALPPPRLFTDDQLRSLIVPTLVLIAGRSVVHDPRRAVQRAEALVPNVQAELWPDATHTIASQCADEVNARILRFTSRP